VQQPKKVLIVRFSSIGDIVLTTPVVRGIKQQLGADVHFLTKKSFRAVLEANPYIDRLWSIDKKIEEVLPALQREEFDLIVDLHKNLRTAKLKWKLGTHSVAFDKLNVAKWLIVNAKVNRLPDIHIVDRYLAPVSPYGVVNDGQGLDYFIPPELEVDLRTFFSDVEVPEGIAPPWDDSGASAYVAFVIGAAHATKRLPQHRIADICRAIPRPVVLLGGPGEAEEGAAIAEQAGPHVINSCGQLKLHESASMVRQAWKVISHDTGLMHIAAAFQKPIISVWGNTIPEFGMYPYYKEGVDRNLTVQVNHLGCRPCSKIGYQQCPKKHFHCMEKQDFSTIIKACQ
jgi:ADP-heptose:LPS heptosyltransferase